MPSLARLSSLSLAALLTSALGCGDSTVSAPVDASATDTGSNTVVDAGEDAGSAVVDAGEDTGSTVTEDVPAAPADVPKLDEPPVVSGPCDGFVSGTVTNYQVDDLRRSFILTLPTGATGTGGHWPVVFNWHGLGDSAPNMNQLLAGEVNNAAFPFILVTPVSTQLGPTTSPLGLEWENLRATTPNREARLFDAVVRCLDERYGVDRDRLYTVGFSAGAIMSDLLGVLRGSQLAAVVSYSGGYFSNPENPATLGALRTYPQWPQLPTAPRYSQLLMFGGESDTFNLFVATARFNVFAANDLPYLNAAGHDVIYCDHGRGHTLPSAILGSRLVQFFAAHRRGERSPWASEIPSGWPSYCAFHAGM
ncbi:MAG: PHB depolymerase family esterase [Polyangiales bacterium]